MQGFALKRLAKSTFFIALPWIHRLFSNLKRWGLGVYHGLRKTNLQHYLDEFVFRFNRRRTRHAAFDTLLGIGARTTPVPYRVLIRAKPHSPQHLEPPEPRAEAITAVILRERTDRILSKERGFAAHRSDVIAEV